MKYTADFETTTDPDDCHVWAWGVCEIGNPDYFKYNNSIESFMGFIQGLGNSTIYFHNLKFDGEFIIHYLLTHGFKHVKDRKEESANTFTTIIADTGQFYAIKIIYKKANKKIHYIQIYDSMKLIPFAVEVVAKAFDLPISKLEIDYKAYREPGHILTNSEVDYLRNDVDIMSRALNILFKQGLDKMTIGANALSNYKSIIGKKFFEKWFPMPTYDSDARQSYKGGWTYCHNPGDKGEGFTLDVNSLYPWVMHDCLLPFGEPIYYEGEYKDDSLYPIYIQMLTCQFEIKPGHLPTIQLKNTRGFIPTQYLKSSADPTGDSDTLLPITLCLTSVDLKLFFDHYNVYNVEFHCGYKFKASRTLFTQYIDYWGEQKIKADREGNEALRTLAKLMLNNLYGKFAKNPRVASKFPYLDNGIVKYKTDTPEMKNPVYIPVGAFITAYARDKTIRTAQLLGDKFLYADTDSVHLEIKLPENLKNMSTKELKQLTTIDLKEMGVNLPDGLEVDPVKLGAWKLENIFYRARFIRTKCYVEDGNKPETWGTEHYNKKLFKITCAGMPAKCHELVNWDNFKLGSKFSGKLQPSHVVGGIVLKDVDFTIKYC